MEKKNREKDEPGLIYGDFSLDDNNRERRRASEERGEREREGNTRLLGYVNDLCFFLLSIAIKCEFVDAFLDILGRKVKQRS